MNEPLKTKDKGRIVTFYSYKGGTGRSMMLANVAWVLASNGHSVLTIDWDLEAPGLHRYFHPFLKDNTLSTSDGLMDAVTEFVEEAVSLSTVELESYPNSDTVSDASAARALDESVSSLPNEQQAVDANENWYIKYANLVRYAVPLQDTKFINGGHIDHIGPGRQGASYATKVNLFDWDDFYEKFAGAAFLDAAKKFMQDKYDYILIDSRTGISDTSGICTMQMPDILVVCFTLNNQSIEGASTVAAAAAEYRLQSKTLKPLIVIPVITRVETGESDRLELGRELARVRFRQFIARPSEDEKVNERYREQFWGRMEVPYIPKYAFEEILATFYDRPHVSISVLAPAEQIASLIRGRVTELVPPSDEDRNLVLARFARKPYIVTIAEDFVASLSSSEQEAARKLFTRMVQISSIQSPSGADVTCRVSVDMLSKDTLSLLDRAISANLVRRVASQSTSTSTDAIEFTDDRVISAWSRLKDWVSQRREFFSWRQQLDQLLIHWITSRDPDDLLTGTALGEAVKHSTAAGEDDLSHSEREFIEASRDLDERVRRLALEANESPAVARALSSADWRERQEFEGRVLQASSTLAGFTHEEEAMARRIFSRLVRVALEPSGDTRLRVKLNELKDLGEPVLSKLLEAGILKMQSDDPSREQTVELVHDVLLHQWSLLSDWLNQDRGFLLWRLRLNAGISTWEQKAHGTGFLLRSKALVEARRWMAERPADFNVIEQTFIGASVRRRRQLNITVVGAVSVLFGLLMVVSVFTYLTSRQFEVVIPGYQKPPAQLVEVEQRWTADQRLYFHHTPIGTRLVPYAWFMALEQPCLSLKECEPFADSKYLQRFGFIPSEADPKLNPDGLPIGFARETDFKDPFTHTTYPVVGLTCAACHTGQLYYGNYAVVIEGAPARIETAEFQRALGVSVVFTKLIPFRYERFEKRVLGDNASDKDKSNLKAAFAAAIDNSKFEKTNTDKLHIYDNPAGFGRTDVLTRIGNQVFAVDMMNAANFAPSNAPVRFPQIWDSSWFTWVQYNSSISDPLVRNIGKALGLRAVAKLYGPDTKEFNNSVDINGLRELETLLSGEAPLGGLSSPKWPAEFPKLDPQKVARGAELYKENCQKCHLPPVSDLLEDLKSPHPSFWWQNSQGKSLIAVKDINASYVGTDPHEAMDFINRTVDTGDLGKGRVSAGVGIDLVAKAIASKYFDGTKLAPAQRIEWSGFGAPTDVAVRSEPIYKARPLNGIWAVAPYLHNGSIPNLYALLSPQEERPGVFWTGSNQFDPAKVGFDTSPLTGGYQYDVRHAGNSNQGHEFKGGPMGNGVIGPALSPDDRFAIIEYLKSL